MGKGGEGERGDGMKGILLKFIRFSLLMKGCAFFMGESNSNFIAALRMLIRRNGEVSADVGVLGCCCPNLVISFLKREKGEGKRRGEVAGEGGESNSNFIA